MEDAKSRNTPEITETSATALDEAYKKMQHLTGSPEPRKRLYDA